MGMDARWKRSLVTTVAARLPDNPVVLDLATGTGDLARALTAARPDALVVGADLSLPMLRAGPVRRAASASDMQMLPHARDTFDAVLAGYAFRNAPDAKAALMEIRRVLRPGGCLAALDFYLPASSVWRHVFLGYLGVAGGLVGRVTHGVAASYGYIASSLKPWMTAHAFADLLRDVGFVDVTAHRRLLGGIAIHVAR